jgi:nitrate reductase gamma subunit
MAVFHRDHGPRFLAENPDFQIWACVLGAVAGVVTLAGLPGLFLRGG